MSTLFAYIDPVTGSLILQLIAAGVMTALVFFKRVKAFVLGTFGFGVVIDNESKIESADTSTIKLEQPDWEDKKVA
ncbi:MAG: hypothetical protein FWG73_01705 [Planctomycetaceae bacterium]|nr:hypothetical protein [Planctomycetaceae bacterium]